MANTPFGYIPKDVQELFQKALVQSNVAKDAAARRIAEGQLYDFKRVLYALEQENLARMRELFVGFADETSVWSFNLINNSEQLQRQISGTLGSNIIFERTVVAARNEFVPLVNKVLLAIFKLASEGLPDGAYPKEYQIALARAVSTLPEANVIQHRPQEVSVTLPNLYKYLGDYNDFVRGFHDQALLPEVGFGRESSIFSLSHPGPSWKGHRVILPYNGERLKEPSSKRRYLAWDALYRGQGGYLIEGASAKPAEYEGRSRDKYGRFKSKSPPKYGLRKGQDTSSGLGYTEDKWVPFPEDASWEATKSARLKVWGTKAPHWVLLEYGQPNFAPRIVPRIVNSIEVINRFRRKHRTYTPTTDTSAGAFSAIESGSDLGVKYTGVSFGLVSTTVSRSGGTRPANITIQWVESLNYLWTQILRSTWAEQVAAASGKSPSNIQREPAQTLTGITGLTSGAFSQPGYSGGFAQGPSQSSLSTGDFLSELRKFEADARAETVRFSTRVNLYLDEMLIPIP